MTPHASEPLVAAACAGEPGAIERLMAVCQPDLKRFARRTCQRSEDADDAVQLALWHMHRSMGALKSIAAFSTWLFRIIERECWRLMRRSPRHGAEPLALDVAATEDPVGLRRDLVKAIEAVPEPYRVVLILRDIDELTAPEVAAELGLSVEAVKSRLFRARAMVRHRLARGGYRFPSGEPDIGSH